MAALVGDHSAVAYCASKGGVAQLTRAMALDYATRGVRVNAICCGEIDTPLFVREAGQLGMTPDEYRVILNEAHPMGRIGLPREAAAAVAFLASDDARLHHRRAAAGRRRLLCDLRGAVMRGLNGKVALVTGGSSGLGEAIVYRLAEEGTSVAVGGRDEAKTKSVGRAGGRPLP